MIWYIPLSERTAVSRLFLIPQRNDVGDRMGFLRMGALSAADDATISPDLGLADSAAIETPPTAPADSAKVSLGLPELPGVVPVTPFPVPWRHPIRAGFWITRMVWGLASLVFFLSVISAIPIVNFLSLGYLLEVEGRVARTGRFRDAFPLLNDAPRFGSIALGIWLWLLPLRYVSGVAADARLIDPGSSADFRLSLLANLLWGAITIHLVMALARGGSPDCFVRPFKNFFWLRARLREGNYLATAGEHVGRFVRQLRLRHHFWLGVRGFAVAFAWLLVPTAIYASTNRPQAGSVLAVLIGGSLLMFTLSWVAFLQARFTAENRFSAGFELRKVRQLWGHAPLCWTLAMIVLYALSLPFYIFKAFSPPLDAQWPFLVIFVVSIYPTRIMTGWAYRQAVRRLDQGRRAHWSIRWLCGGVLMPLLAAYVFILFFTQFLGAEGKQTLFQHHALLLPSPF